MSCNRRWATERMVTSAAHMLWSLSDQKHKRISHVRKLGFVLVLCAWVAPAMAQQRPLETQDPETIGAGRVLVEGWITAAQDVTFPQYGLKGDLRQLPVLGVNVGLSSIADLQITGGPYNYLSI